MRDAALINTSTLPDPRNSKSNGLSVASYLTAALAGLEALMFGLAFLGNDNALSLSLQLGIAGMLLAVGCLVWAKLGSGAAPKPMRWTLPLPFAVSSPIFYLAALGYGLGGDAAACRLLLTLATIALICIPVTFLVVISMPIQGKRTDSTRP